MNGRRLVLGRLVIAVAVAVLATACVEESAAGDRPTAYRDGRVQTPASDTHGGTSWGGKGRAGEHKLYTRMK
jgi:hypothetical protein